jgi:hypothetical protein
MERSSRVTRNPSSPSFTIRFAFNENDAFAGPTDSLTIFCKSRRYTPFVWAFCHFSWLSPYPALLLFWRYNNTHLLPETRKGTRPPPRRRWSSKTASFKNLPTWSESLDPIGSSRSSQKVSPADARNISSETVLSRIEPILSCTYSFVHPQCNGSGLGGSINRVFPSASEDDHGTF